MTFGRNMLQPMIRDLANGREFGPESRFRMFQLRTGQDCIDFPFTCDHCQRPSMELELIDGDGFLICRECMDGTVAILRGDA